MPGSYLGALRGLHRNVLLYFVATALIGFSIDGGIYSVVFNLYLLRLGFGPEYIGLVNSAGMMVFALASLPAGALGGRLGYRPMVLAGMLLTAVGGLLMPMAQTIAPQALGGWLIAAYSLTYLGLAVYFVNAVPFVMEATTGPQRGLAFSLQTGLLALAATFGSLIGGYLPRVYASALHVPLNHPEPYRFPLFISVALMAPALVALLMTQPRERPVPAHGEPAAIDLAQAEMPRFSAERRRVARQSVVAVILAFGVIRFLQVAGIGSAGTFYNVYFDTQLNVPTSEIGLISAAARLISVPAALMVPALVARWSAPRVVTLASTATALAILLLIYAQGWVAAGLGYIAVVVLSAVRYPAYLTYTMEMVPSNWRGVLSGSGEMAGGLSFALLALVGGYIIVTWGYNTLFFTGIALTMAGTVLFWAYARKLRERRAALAASGALPGPSDQLSLSTDSPATAARNASPKSSTDSQSVYS